MSERWAGGKAAEQEPGLPWRRIRLWGLVLPDALMVLHSILHPSTQPEPYTQKVPHKPVQFTVMWPETSVECLWSARNAEVLSFLFYLIL